MAKLFRLSCSLDSYLSSDDNTVRPTKPDWLLNEDYSTRNQRHSYEYWTKIYWATPPWITREMMAEMKRIYTEIPANYHVDHIVPLTSSIVCGLHVPWNLQQLPDKTNLVKSNHMWPGHPCETIELFPLEYDPHQMRLAI